MTGHNKNDMIEAQQLNKLFLPLVTKESLTTKLISLGAMNRINFTATQKAKHNHAVDYINRLKSY